MTEDVAAHICRLAYYQLQTFAKGNLPKRQNSSPHATGSLPSWFFVTIVTQRGCYSDHDHEITIMTCPFWSIWICLGQTIVDGYCVEVSLLLTRREQ